MSFRPLFFLPPPQVPVVPFRKHAVCGIAVSLGLVIEFIPIETPPVRFPRRARSRWLRLGKVMILSPGPYQTGSNLTSEVEGGPYSNYTCLCFKRDIRRGRAGTTVRTIHKRYSAASGRFSSVHEKSSLPFPRGQTLPCTTSLRRDQNCGHLPWMKTSLDPAVV